MASKHLVYDGDLKLNRCNCGGRAEVWRSPIDGAYYIRCKTCYRHTERHITEEVAIEEWNDGVWMGGE